ncbi:hypothetical protein E2C01_030940 [Portunus trituberculatus]|uniref:Uncharacterized protein n=1 Tax=Portunus trituberculatus TaxID=210409 RepID=A0A5B7EWR5_PORTR|nr:hypothetical protein [Portunus trituberculatus]
MCTRMFPLQPQGPGGGNYSWESIDVDSLTPEPAVSDKEKLGEQCEEEDRYVRILDGGDLVIQDEEKRVLQPQQQRRLPQILKLPIGG